MRTMRSTGSKVRSARRQGVAIGFAAAVLAVVVTAGNSLAYGQEFDRVRDRVPPFVVRTLDGTGNNVAHPMWGAVGTNYLRVAPAGYRDGVTAQRSGPDPRYVSNRVFNDTGQNIFSTRGLTQWVWVWGQFLDHTFGLRQSTGGEDSPLAFDPKDPLEAFRNDLGLIAFERTPAAPGTGAGSTIPRQQVNTVSSYIDGFAVYGGTRERLDWLRHGPVDGDPTNNGAELMLPDGYLAKATARGDVSTAPTMELMGRLAGHPDAAVVAGDVRANENLALTAVHTLFAREHNRIVAALPRRLSEQLKFEIARRVVGAEQQYITYSEFLPAVGVTLAPYTGYRPSVDASLSNEFATVGYRMHSMIHGEFEIHAAPGTYSAEQLAMLAAKGIAVQQEPEGNQFLTVPLHVAFGDPALVEQIGLGPILAGLASEGQYANDEQIDNQLRSVLFQIPSPSTPDPSVCFGPEADPACFTGVVDLGAIDVQRGHDHGIPTYNRLRVAYGLPPVRTFAALTGEETQSFPDDPEIDPANPIDDPDILDFVTLFDGAGGPIQPGTEEADEGVTRAQRRSPLAARLAAIYRTPDRLDAFTGMVSEPHLADSELGELQHAIWKDQFERLRDGDRFFFANDPLLARIERRFGISFRRTLAEIIVDNTGLEPFTADVFRLAIEMRPSGHVLKSVSGTPGAPVATASPEALPAVVPEVKSVILLPAGAAATLGLGLLFTRRRRSAALGH